MPHQIDFPLDETNMTDNDRDALQLCESGLQQMWNGAVDAEIASYDRALEIAESD